MSNDKRVIKTKKAITTAFLQLALEKDMRKITVSDISERAMINRSTFYLHYSDARDVLDSIEKEISRTISEHLAAFDTENIFDSTYNLFISLTRLLDEKPDYKNFILLSTSSGYIISNIKKTLAQRALQTIPERDEIITADRKTAVDYMVSGIVDSYIQWALEDSGDEMPLEKFCATISRLTEAVIAVVH